MNRPLTTVLVVAAAALVGASCSDGVPTAPLAPAATTSASTRGAYYAQGSPSSSRAGLVSCEHHPAYVGTAEIGANGGQILVGTSRVIFPPGALTTKTRITARIPEGEHLTMTFDFEPHGVVFKKPAGLVFDASTCDIPSWYAPDIVYLGDNGEILEHIQSYYSNYWHFVAAPIWHFSRYAVAW
jgi:hypothetical protein